MKSIPISGKDAKWLEFCFFCKKQELFVSRNGLRIGGFGHCYGCGNEYIIDNLDGWNLRAMINSAYCHWLKFPKLPYKFHELTEQEKMSLLFSKNRS